MNIKDTLKERQNTHGDFSDNARIAQGIKALLRSGPKWDELPEWYKEGLEMDAHKSARIVSGDWKNPDHVHDKQGYIKLIEDRLHGIIPTVDNNCSSPHVTMD